MKGMYRMMETMDLHIVNNNQPAMLLIKEKVRRIVFQFGRCLQHSSHQCSLVFSSTTGGGTQKRRPYSMCKTMHTVAVQGDKCCKEGPLILHSE